MMQQALQFLQDHNEVAFATSDGHLPKIRIFQIMKQEGTVLYFATSTEKAIWKELQANPNVEVLAYADNISVRCSGMVNFDVEDDVKQWIYDNNPVLPRLYSSYDQLVYFVTDLLESGSKLINNPNISQCSPEYGIFFVSLPTSWRRC